MTDVRAARAGTKTGALLTIIRDEYGGPVDGETLAADTGLDKRAVWLTCRRLEVQGLIVRVGPATWEAVR